VEVVEADESMHVAMAEAQGEVQEGEVECLMGKDLLKCKKIILLGCSGARRNTGWGKRALVSS
jgi:hypothetical protein